MEVKFKFFKNINGISLEKKFSVKNILEKYLISNKNWRN